MEKVKQISIVENLVAGLDYEIIDEACAGFDIIAYDKAEKEIIYIDIYEVEKFEDEPRKSGTEIEDSSTIAEILLKPSAVENLGLNIRYDTFQIRINDDLQSATIRHTKGIWK